MYNTVLTLLWLLVYIPMTKYAAYFANFRDSNSVEISSYNSELISHLFVTRKSTWMYYLIKNPAV